MSNIMTLPGEFIGCADMVLTNEALQNFTTQFKTGEIRVAERFSVEMSPRVIMLNGPDNRVEIAVSNDGEPESVKSLDSAGCKAFLTEFALSLQPKSLILTNTENAAKLEHRFKGVEQLAVKHGFPLKVQNKNDVLTVINGKDAEILSINKLDIKNFGEAGALARYNLFKLNNLIVGCLNGKQKLTRLI